jgi:CheY-like chemotaxis protein
LVGDGEDALEAIRQRRTDLVFPNVMMLRLDGFDLLRRLCSDQALRHPEKRR